MLVVLERNEQSGDEELLQRGKTVLKEARWLGKETEAEGGDEKLIFLSS